MALYRLEVSAFAYEKCKIKYLLSERPQYGANERGVERDSALQPRYVRITDIDEYGRLRPGMGVAAEKYEDKYLLCKGDLLFARSGNTVGKAYLHNADSGEKHIFAGYMIRFRLNLKKVLPEYIFLCTQLHFYRKWVMATQRATGQPNINAEEYRNLEIPIPCMDMQKRITALYKDAIERFEKSLQSAALLLNGIDDFLLSELGISLPLEPGNRIDNRIFTVQRKELGGWRFDPQALHPERGGCVNALRQLNSYSLKSACAFVRDLRTEIPEGATYIGLENIESNTGRYLPSSDKDTVSSAFAFRKGQVLFPKLRPYLNKVFLASFDGLCSTEFHVLEGRSVRSDFLALFLRSQAVVKQTKHLMSGNTLPRLQTEDIEDLLIPVADSVVQEKIVGEANRRMIEAENLRTKAASELGAAKCRIEAMLLGEVTV